MKRYTDTEKWSDPWFRKLPPHLKCLWLWLCDRCLADGILKDIDWENASFQIGQPVTEGDLPSFGPRVERLSDGKYLVAKFVKFQYGKLSRDCKGQVHVFKALEDHGLVERFSENMKSDAPNPPRQNSPAKPQSAHQRQIHEPSPQEQQALTKISDFPIEKKFPGHCARAMKNLRKLLNARFSRPADQRWSYAEETALVAVAGRELPVDELRAIQDMLDEVEIAYMPKIAKSLISFLENWTTLLEQAAGSGCAVVRDRTGAHSDYFVRTHWTREGKGPQPEDFDDNDHGKRDLQSFREAWEKWKKM